MSIKLILLCKLYFQLNISKNPYRGFEKKGSKMKFISPNSFFEVFAENLPLFDVHSRRQLLINI